MNLDDCQLPTYQKKENMMRDKVGGKNCKKNAVYIFGRSVIEGKRKINMRRKKATPCK